MLSVQWITKNKALLERQSARSFYLRMWSAERKMSVLCFFIGLMNSFLLDKGGFAVDVDQIIVKLTFWINCKTKRLIS